MSYAAAERGDRLAFEELARESGIYGIFLIVEF